LVLPPLAGKDAAPLGWKDVAPLNGPPRPRPVELAAPSVW
jgi:hypothetical protein